MTAVKAYSYTRFSTPDQSKGDSRRRQHSKAEAYAAAHGMTLDTELTFEDLGVSGFRGRNVEVGRLADFKEAVESGAVPRGSYLLVENLDRISRLAARKALKVVEDIVEMDIAVVTLDDGRAYTEKVLDEDPTALLIALLTLIRANEESQRKSERLRAAWVGKRLKVHERILTTRAPAWLRVQQGEFRVIEERAAVVRRVFEMIDEGTGLETIAKKLNDDQVPVFGGARYWQRSYVAKVASNQAVIGVLVPHVVDYAKDPATGRQKRSRRPLDPVMGYYPAIVDPELFRRVQSLRDRRMPSTRGAGVKNVLAGLATCAVCGGSMTRVSKGSRKKAGKPYLVCARAKMGAGCKYSAVPQERVEALLRTALPDLRPLETDQRITALANIEVASRDLLDTQRKIEALVSVVADTQSLAVVAELERLERHQVDLRRHIAGLQDLASPQLTRGLARLNHAAHLEPQQLNVLLRQVFSRVEVAYENGEGWIGPVWRDGRTSMIFLD